MVSESSLMTGPAGTVTLWRPTGPTELKLVEQSGWKRWPPRLPEQPIFYPVLNQAYATRIAREWNVPSAGSGYVTCFNVSERFLDRYEVQKVGGKGILEYWIPAADLEAFNANIVGHIREIAEFRASVPNEEIQAAEQVLGAPVPEAWRHYLQQSSWFRRGWLSDECFVRLHRPSESIDDVGAWGVGAASHPGIMIIGDDGAGEQLALDLREKEPRVVAVNYVSTGWDEAIEQSESLCIFLEQIENNSFRFRF